MSVPLLCGLPVTVEGNVPPLHTIFRRIEKVDLPTHLFESFNGNCRATLLDRLKCSDSRIVCAQEISTAEHAIADLQRATRTHGFRMVCSPSFE
eukprot:3048035-Pyramimonas_sp.AAC.1